MDDTVRRRRAIGLLTTGVVVAALSFGFGHRGVHAVRSLIVPGAGLYEQRHLLLGVALTVAAIAATVAWMRWGMDWSVAAVLVLSMALSAALAYDDHPVNAPQVAAAAHEFPLVVLVMGGVSWLRLAWRRSPVGRRRAARTEAALPAVDQARAAAIAALAGGRTEFDHAALRSRCARVGLAARGRFGGDPFRRDHAHARAALALTDGLSPEQLERLGADAHSALFGVPASEPGWVRLLDGTLAASALQRAGHPDAAQRWTAALQHHFDLRRGHRSGAFWTPLGVRGPRAAAWEHAAATGLARAQGWITVDDDWQALRTRALAAASRGNAVADDERLVAAARIWLCVVDDPQATKVLGRVTVHRDPIAVALDSFATSFNEQSPLHPTRSTA